MRMNFGDCDPEIAYLVDWYQSRRADLPLERYVLEPGVLITDPDRFYFGIDDGIAGGPHGFAAVSGALREDLELLHARFGSALCPGPNSRLKTTVSNDADDYALLR